MKDKSIKKNIFIRPSIFLIALLTTGVVASALDIWTRNAATNTTQPTTYNDLINVSSLKINNQDVCLRNGTNCKTGLNQEIMIIKDVNLIALTKTYCNITFIGGLANTTSC